MRGPEVEVFLIVQAAATLFMTGLIWFVQIVHYPLMARVGTDTFANYGRAHSRLTTWVVGPPMLIEAGTALVTIFLLPADVPRWEAWLGLVLLAAIWISTATLQVPQHRQLAEGYSASAHRRLVSTNWIRVAGWTSRAVLVLHWLAWP